MERIAPESNAALEGLSHDRFWGQEPSEGLGAIHLLSSGKRVDWLTASRLDARQVERDLFQRFGRQQPDWSAHRVGLAARSARAALAEAIYRQADRDLRFQAAHLMTRAAADLNRAAADPAEALAILARLHAAGPGRERIGKFESLGLSPAAARGLDLQMANFEFDRIAAKLSRPRGLAMPSRAPLDLTEFQAGLARSATALSALAARLGTDRSLHVFDLCPVLARGLLSRLPAGTLAHQAITERLERHAWCKRVDSHLALAAGLVFQIGALLAGPLGQAAQWAWGGLEGARSLSGGTELRKHAGLAWLAGGMDDRDLANARAQADRAQVLGGATAYSQVVQGGSLLVSLLDEATAG